MTSDVDGEDAPDAAICEARRVGEEIISSVVFSSSAAQSTALHSPPQSIIHVSCSFSLSLSLSLEEGAPNLLSFNKGLKLLIDCTLLLSPFPPPSPASLPELPNAESIFPFLE